MSLVARTVFLSFAALALCASPTMAKTKNQAEAERLSSEMESLARRTAWSGVSRSYAKLMKLKKVEIKNETHLLGSQAASQLGDVETRIEALQRSGSVGANDLRSVFATYGAVKLTKGKKKALTPAAMPFAPDQRSAIEAAQKAIKSKGKFKGWLPKGDYTLGAASFTVKATKQVQKFKGK